MLRIASDSPPNGLPGAVGDCVERPWKASAGGVASMVVAVCDGIVVSSWAACQRFRQTLGVLLCEGWVLFGIGSGDVARQGGFCRSCFSIQQLFCFVCGRVGAASCTHHP